jgi:hypothetical protein
MEFRLPGRSFRVGERIEGTMVVTPHQDFKAQEVRVELVRAEGVSRDAHNYSETVQTGEVVEESPRYQTGSSREYPFVLDVPEAAGPCLQTAQTFVVWTLRAMMPRSMNFDLQLGLGLNVYNGLATTAES